MRTRSWIATLTAGGLVVAGAVGLGSMTTANADTATNGPGTVAAAGDLYLDTTSLPTKVTYSLDASNPETIAVAARTKCGLATSGTPYLSFASSTGTGVSSQPGYAINSQNGASVGVQSSKENGLACSQVNDTPAESLTIQLNQSATSPFASQPGFAVRAKSADFDLNLAGNAIVTADLYRGTQRVGGAELQSGFSAVQQLQHPTDQLFVCSTSSNSGPQSINNNNCYWNISQLVFGASAIYNTTSAPGVPVGNGVDGSITKDPGPGGLDFDRVVLNTVVGAFSVQGGGQWPSSDQMGHRTHIALESASDGTLLCDQTTQLVSTTTNGDITSIQVARVSNGDANQKCSAINYTLDASDGTVTFHKQLIGTDSSDQSSAQFAVTFVRTLAPTSAGVATYPTAVKVNWEDGTANRADTVKTLTYCPTSVFQPGQPFTWPGNPSPLDMTTYLAGTQYSCQFGETQTENADGSVNIIDKIYLTGDVKYAY